MKKSLVKRTASVFSTKNIGLLAIGLIIIVIAVLTSDFKKQRTTQQASAATISPLIFGTNLTLQDANDQFITSSNTRSLLSQIHVQLIRMPIRSAAPSSPSPWEITAMQSIQQIGATPLIVLKFHQTDPLGAATAVLKQAASIFGNKAIYVELGNEVDLAFGVTSQQYTTEWNQVIPQVKAIDPNAQFIGPVNFQSNPAYEADFYHNATVKPDAISWHEYTCGNGADPQTVCIGHIANWKNHIAAFKAAITANGDQVPPIFITEWNYDPNNPNPDSRATAQFQQQFTQTALQELANDGVTGATHYVATGHQYYNLIDPGDVLTPEGQAFGQMWTTLGMGSSTPSPITPSVNPTISVIPSAISQAPSQTPSVTLSPTISPTITVSVSPSPVASPTPIGGSICSGTAVKACSYTSECGSYHEGTVCEKQVNGCNKSSSGNNVYICHNGKWVYNHWVRSGQCNFCGVTKNIINNSSTDLEHEN